MTVRALWMIGAALSFCACHQLIVRAPVRTAGIMPVESHNQGSVIAGLINVSEPANLDCPGGLESVTVRRSAFDATLHFFIGGLYTARTVDVACYAPVLPVDVKPVEKPGEKKPQPAVAANRILLKNGRVLEGRIVNQNQTTVTLEVDGRRQTIQKADIRRIEYRR